MTSKRKVTWAKQKGFMASHNIGTEPECGEFGEGPFDYEFVPLHQCNGECTEVLFEDGKHKYTVHDIKCRKLFAGNSRAVVLIIGGAKVGPIREMMFQFVAG